MAVLSKVKRYKEAELDLDELARKAQLVLNRKPFLWQLEVAEAILCGEDVIVDVGTGSGKTLCFTLPLLADGAEDDIILTVSPLTALMIDQANTSQLPTVAVCAEIIAKVGLEQLYKDIICGRFRQVLVSPEVATSSSFNTAILQKAEFYSRLRAVCIDEAHCISLWGGSFRPDYADLGVLRGR